MSLGQWRVCVPTASGWSCVSREIYKVEQRKIPRYSRVLYHQKGTRTPMWAASSTVCGSAGLRLWIATGIHLPSEDAPAGLDQGIGHFIPTVSLGVTYAAVCTYGYD